MERNKAIPQGYMTVGEVAKKMGVTVRTLQYYHEEGLLLPSSESEGGRRLYTDKDVIKLHQILSLKHLGFSLDDIKNCLTSLDTPADVADALSEQATAIRKKIETLSESLKEIETLRAEVLQMKSVDFKKYADIIVNLQMKNDFYWLIKHFDETTLDHFRSRFDMDSGSAMMETINHLNNEALQLQKEGVLPDSEKGQNLAKAYWNMVMDFKGFYKNVYRPTRKSGFENDLEGMFLRGMLRNIAKNELHLLLFIIVQEIIRVLMKVRDDLSIGLNQVIIMVIIVAILSVIQQLLKKKK